MKTDITFSGIFLLSALVLAMPLLGQPCDNGISTNPNDPINDQFVQMGNDFFPPNSSNGTVDTYNPFLNSFEWYFNAPTIQLFPDEVNWIHFFSSFTNPVNMQHPFGGSMPTEFQYLRPDSVNPEFRDFRWEDGWELLYMNLGYFPDLNHTDEPAPGSYYANHNQSYDPIPSNIPYFVLYNRYRGLLRLFANVWYPVGSNFEDINVTIQFTEPSSAFQKVTGLLRHASAYDLPLSEKTAITAVHAPRYHAPNYTQWIVADFQMAYDPCTCQSQGELEFRFIAFNSLDVDIIGRSISLEVPINDNNYTTRNFMNLSNINTNEYEPGTEIYQNMDSMLVAYERQQEAYLEQLEEYNEYNTLQRRLFRLGVRTVVTALTKGVSEVVFSDSVATVVLGGDLGEISGLIGVPQGLPTEELQDILSDWVKERIAESNNTLLMEVYGPSPTKPKPVAVPVATLEESVYKGTITGIDTTFSSPMVLPGSLPGAYPQGTSLEPQRIPVYNEVMGQVAMLDIPSPLIHFNSNTTAVEVTQDYDTYDSPGPFDYSCERKESWTHESKFDLRFDTQFDLALNQILDFDMDQTTTKILVEITVSNGVPESLNNLVEDYQIEQIEGNLTLKSASATPAGRSYSYQSKWVSLEDLNQMVFSLGSRNAAEILKYGFLEWDPDDPYCFPPNPWHLDNHPNIVPSSLELEIDKVSFKVMHNFYFDQIGTSGTQVNVLEVQSYLLYDRLNGINKFDEEPTLWSDNPVSGEFDAYIVGTITLGDETINTSHPFVNEVIGNEIFINAQEIIIDGPLQVQSGYTLVIQALEQIHQTIDAVFNPKIQMRIKKDFYDTPVFDYADNTEIQSFCDSTLYQANVDAASVSVGPPNQEGSAEFSSPQEIFNRDSVTLYPNPARDLLTLRSSHLDMSSITIHDLSGRPIKQESLQSNTRETQVNLSGIAPGTYIIRVDCGDEVFSEKLVVTK